MHKSKASFHYNFSAIQKLTLSFDVSEQPEPFFGTHILHTVHTQLNIMWNCVFFFHVLILNIKATFPHTHTQKLFNVGKIGFIHCINSLT